MRDDVFLLVQFFVLLNASSVSVRDTAPSALHSELREDADVHVGRLRPLLPATWFVTQSYGYFVYKRVCSNQAWSSAPFE